MMTAPRTAELQAEYLNFTETLDSGSRIPTYDEWYASFYTPPIKETPKWPIEPARDAVRKKPVTSVLAALLLGLTSGGILGAKEATIGAAVLDLLTLFGL